MASLPLFASSFMPSGSGAFVPLSDRAAAQPVVPSLAPASPTVSAPSPIETTEAALREAGLGGRFWRGDSLCASPLPSTPSGFRALDEQLPGGGWPSRCLTELMLAHPGVGEIRFLAATLSSLTQAGREIVLLAPPHIPDPTGWAQLGIDMRRVLIVRAERPADRLWALQESLRSAAFGALVAWLPEDKVLARHDALRRLQSAAASADGLTFLMRPLAAQHHASPAPLRLTLAIGAPEAHRRTLSVRLLKRRGPVLAKPLTLLLPEIHRGMKAFGRVAQPARAPVGASRPSVRPASTLPSSARIPLSSTPSHALAGALLSDTGA